MDMYTKASATSLAKLLDFGLGGGDSGMEDGGLSQEVGGVSGGMEDGLSQQDGDTWMLHASTLPLLLDTSREVVISDPYRVMTSAKQANKPDCRDIYIYTGDREEQTKRKDLFDRQSKMKFREKDLRRRKKKKRISSFSPSFSSPAKILPTSAPVKRKKMVGLLSSQEVAFNKLLEN